MHEYHIYMGADHRGFEKKEALFELIKDCHENVIVEDLGYEEYNEGDDFNDPAKAVAKAVSGDEHSFGVLMCGSGQGVCIQANRIKGARAVRVKTPEGANMIGPISSACRPMSSVSKKWRKSSKPFVMPRFWMTSVISVACVNSRRNNGHHRSYDYY